MICKLPLLSLVCLGLSKQVATAFSLAPRLGSSSNSALHFSLLKKHEFGFKSFSSSFPTKTKKQQRENKDENEEGKTTATATATATTTPSLKKNDMSMFLERDGDEKLTQEELDFFMTKDESIQQLEDVEEFFRSELPLGIAMNEKGRAAPFATAHDDQKEKQQRLPKNDAIKMTDNNGMSVDEDCPSKKLMYYNYEGTRSKINRNLCNNPADSYFD
uniref:Calmodulin n=1 Tax=Pseudo-nitzschia australis TaxID=44445 RepID=A0A7S4AG56_9STRA